MAGYDYDFKLPTEGFNKQTLPIIPTSTLLTPMPLEHNSMAKRPDQIDESCLFQDEHGRVCVRPSDELAVDALRVLQLYNRYLGVLPQPYDEVHRFLSSESVRCGSDINRIVSKADEEVRPKLEEMQRIAQRMLRQVELDDRFFEDGFWAFLNHTELSEKLKTCESFDPDRLVLLVRRSFQRAVELSPDSGFMNKLDAIVQHLVTAENGRYHALELCVALRLNGALMSQPYNRSSLPNRDSNDLNHAILELLGAHKRESGDLFSMLCKQEVDLGALKRRLCHYVEQQGCSESPIGISTYAQSADCLCERRATLELLHDLQIGAYGQFRSKVWPTIRLLVPEELCEMVFECAMAAKEIAIDPRVTTLDLKISYKLFTP